MEESGNRLTREELLKVAVALGAGAAVGLRAPEPASAALERGARPPKKYCWAKTDSSIVGYPCDLSNEISARFWEADQLTAFHDRVLAGVTTRVQGILDKVAGRPPRAGHTLGFIGYQSQLFLVWARIVVRRPTKVTLDASAGFARVVRELGLAGASRQEGGKYWVLDEDWKFVSCPRGPGTCADGLWRAARTTPWHTRELAEATSAVEAVLDDVRGTAPPNRELSIISYDSRPFLVWTVANDQAMTAEDDTAKVVKGLRLKTS